MELGLGPLGGKFMSGGAFRGNCVLKMILGSLSSDGWGCVPSLLFVCPEASQNWSLQAVEWGQASFPKWPPLGELMLMIIPWGPQ